MNDYIVLVEGYGLHQPVCQRSNQHGSQLGTCLHRASRQVDFKAYGECGVRF